MKLSGHKGSVYCLAYDPQGDVLCSGSFDSTCLLWNAGGNCENINVLSGHKNAILDVKFTCDSTKIITASADYILGVYDAMTGTRIKRFMGHKGIVNAVDVCHEGCVRGFFLNEEFSFGCFHILMPSLSFIHSTDQLHLLSVQVMIVLRNCGIPVFEGRWVASKTSTKLLRLLMQTMETWCTQGVLTIVLRPGTLGKCRNL